MPANCCCKKSRSNRNPDKSSYIEDEADKEQINSIVCKKSMVIVFNIIFMVIIIIIHKPTIDIIIIFICKLCGVALTGFGTYTIKTKHEYVRLLTSAFYEVSTYMILTTGSIIIITTLLGIIGAWIGSKKVLVAVILSLTFIENIIFL